MSNHKSPVDDRKVKELQTELDKAIADNQRLISKVDDLMDELRGTQNITDAIAKALDASRKSRKFAIASFVCSAAVIAILIIF